MEDLINSFDCFERAIQLDPDNYEWRNYIAGFYLEKKKENGYYIY